MVDASPGGVLIAFAEPIGLLVGQRICVSLTLDDGALHLLASVVRVERGDDFRTYVGVMIGAGADDVPEDPDSRRDDPELGRWRDWLESERRALVSSRSTG